MPRASYAFPMAKTSSAHAAALAALLTPEERQDYERRQAALLARNALLQTIETAREHEDLSKKQLAERAGLDPSSVRRLLAAETANPTAENAFRLHAAAGVKVEAVLPSGDRISIV